MHESGYKPHKHAFFVDFECHLSNDQYVMPEYSIRKLKDSDIKAAFRLVIDSTNHLRKLTGFEQIRLRVTKPEPLLLHLKHTDPDGCIGAFAGDKLIGYASSIIRESQWYLAYLFVRPGRWSQGIGQKLLKRVLKTANPGRVNTFSLCTFAYNPQAVALYSRFGMPPVEPISILRWQRKDKSRLKLPRPGRELDIRQVSDYEDLRFINKLDRANRGIARPEEHKFFIDNEKTNLVRLYDGRKAIGYAVVYTEGMIAPVSAIEADYLPDMVATLVKYQYDRQTPQIGFYCPGSNGSIMKSLLESGMMIREVTLLMSNRRFGNLDNYLPAHLAVF